MGTFALTDKAVLLRPEDDVAVAKAEIPAGSVLEDGAARITVRQDIRPGHKVARRALAPGAPVRRYGQVIGFATQPIAVGDHVHTQNLGIGALGAERYEVGVDVRPVDLYPPDRMRPFAGSEPGAGGRSWVAEPELWVIAITPSTLGNSRWTSRNLSFTNWETLAEQLTPEMIAT